MSKLAANSVWQLTAFATRAVSGLGTVVLLARTGGPDTLGLYQYALMLTALMPYYFGLPTLLAREVARRPEQCGRWVEGGTAITLLAGGFFTVVFTLGAQLVGASDTTAVAVSVASLAMVLDGLSRVIFAAFWAWERMHLEALVTTLQEVALVGGIVVVVAAGRGVVAAIVVYAMSRAAGALLAWVLVSWSLGRVPLPRGEPRALWEMARRSTPFAINDTLTLTYMRADSVMLGIFKGASAVGLYQAGTNLVLNLNIFARSVNYAVFPRLSRAWPDRLQEFRRLRDSLLRTIGLVAVPVAIGSMAVASETLRFLYGDRFADAVVAYQLLIVVIPIRMLGHTFSLALSAADLQGKRMIAVAAAAGLNVAINLFAIPAWSYVGAAIATVVSESLLFVAYVVLLHRAAGWADLVGAIKVPIAASIPMLGVVVAVHDRGFLFAAGTGAAAYATALAALALARAPRAMWSQPRAMAASLVHPAP